MSPCARRILFIDHTAVLGGGELALLALLRVLDRACFTPVVLLLSEGPLVHELDGLAETHVLPLPDELLTTRRDALAGRSLPWNKAKALLGYLRQLANTIDALRPDLIHANSLKADLLGGLIARVHGVPQIWHIRDRITEEYLPASAVRGFRAACATIPDALIANSRSTLESLHLSDPARATVINSGLDLQPFLDAAAHAPSLVTDIAAGSTIHIGTIGRISPWKGQEIFLQAAAIVRRTVPKTHFHIVGAPLFGEAAFEATLHDLTRILALEDAVTFTGFRRDIPDYFRRLHIVVHASVIPEPFGQVIVQGMAARRPVIATEGGGPSEILEDGQTGFLVPRKDPEALAAALLRILHHPEAADAVAKRGQAEAIGRYGAAVTTRSVEALYTRLLPS